MPRFAPVMPADDLDRLLVDLALRHDFAEEYGPIERADPHLMDRAVSMLLEELLPSVVDDWAKVGFSTENLSVLGTRTTPDGVPYLDMRVGGDWESPLLAILYWDGKAFRGFVPKEGNAYNHKEKKAVGNSDSDADQARIQFGPKADLDRGVDVDVARTAQAIHNRIAAKGTYTTAPGAVVSKAAQAAKRQATIEQGLNLSGPLGADVLYAHVELAAGAAYVWFELRASGRKLRVDEADRVVGAPASFRKTKTSDYVIWYSPDGCYPVDAARLLQAAGFVLDPTCDVSVHAGARTVYIRL